MGNNTYTNSTWAMHSRFDAKLVGKNVAHFDSVFKHLVEILFDVEMLLSCHHPEALTTRINHLRAGEKIHYPDEFETVLKISKTYFERTMGLFDVTLGSGRSIFEREPIAIPPPEQKQLQPFNLDFGGFGKGYALRKIKVYLETTELESAYITFGGNSALVMSNLDENFLYAISDLNKGFQLKNNGVSVSSNASIMGHNNHIIHPATFRAVDANLITAVKTDDVLDAEVLSTALLPAEPSSYQQIINQFDGAEVYIADRIEPDKLLHLFAK